MTKKLKKQKNNLDIFVKTDFGTMSQHYSHCSLIPFTLVLWSGIDSRSGDNAPPGGDVDQTGREEQSPRIVYSLRVSSEAPLAPIGRPACDGGVTNQSSWPFSSVCRSDPDPPPRAGVREQQPRGSVLRLSAAAELWGGQRSLKTPGRYQTSLFILSFQRRFCNLGL